MFQALAVLCVALPAVWLACAVKPLRELSARQKATLAGVTK